MISGLQSVATKLETECAGMETRLMPFPTYTVNDLRGVAILPESNLAFENEKQI